MERQKAMKEVEDKFNEQLEMKKKKTDLAKLRKEEKIQKQQDAQLKKKVKQEEIGLKKKEKHGVPTIKKRPKFVTPIATSMHG